MRPVRRIGALALALAALLVPAPADASTVEIAALQSALQGLRLYSGYVDGVKGPLTRDGVRALQRRRGLAVDGIAGPETRRALGWRGRPGLGSRVMRSGDKGWDVAALQFLLQRAGQGAGRADGVFGPLTWAAVARAQEAAGVGVDGQAGPVTISSLRAGAAGVGTVIYAAYNGAGYGNLVVIQHRLGYTSWYGHMSAITAYVGEEVVGGTRIGYVGATGDATGPHLHFEVRHYDTPIDPAPLMLATVAARAATTAPSAMTAPRGPAGGCDGLNHPRHGDWIAGERLCAER
ncbi:MAG TPA: peptidoglycan-binding protein [Solirubrobacterales bacterium]